jgi:hypothetical protein
MLSVLGIACHNVRNCLCCPKVREATHQCLGGHPSKQLDCGSFVLAGISQFLRVELNFH